MTGLVTADNNADSNSPRSHIANRQEVWFDLNQPALSLSALLLAVISPAKYARLNRKISDFNLITFDNTLIYKMTHPVPAVNDILEQNVIILIFGEF